MLPESCWGFGPKRAPAASSCVWKSGLKLTVLMVNHIDCPYLVETAPTVVNLGAAALETSSSDYVSNTRYLAKGGHRLRKQVWVYGTDGASQAGQRNTQKMPILGLRMFMHCLRLQLDVANFPIDAGRVDMLENATPRTGMLVLYCWSAVTAPAESSLYRPSEGPLPVGGRLRCKQQHENRHPIARARWKFLKCIVRGSEFVFGVVLILVNVSQPRGSHNILECSGLFRLGP